MGQTDVSVSAGRMTQGQNTLADQKLDSLPVSTLAVSLTSTSESHLSSVEVDTSLTVMDHYCPTHGHLLLSISTEPEFDMVSSGMPTKNQNTENVWTTNLFYANPIHSEACVSSEMSDHTEHAAKATERTSPAQNNTLTTQSSESDQSFSLKEQHRPNRDPIVKGINRYRTQLASIRVNMVTCALSIALWTPYIMATTTRVLLGSTPYDNFISLQTIIQFKWVNYMASFAYSLGILIVDRHMCKSVLHHVRQIFLCKTRRHRRSSPVSCIPNSTWAFPCLANLWGFFTSR